MREEFCEIIWWFQKIVVFLQQKVRKSVINIHKNELCSVNYVAGWIDKWMEEVIHNA